VRLYAIHAALWWPTLPLAASTALHTIAWVSHSENVFFTLAHRVQLPARQTYDLLCDWEDHSRWVPFTRVESFSEGKFVAFTGIGPLQLEDNMRVTRRDDDAMRCEIVKTGPRLLGSASFSVHEVSAQECVITWSERLVVPYLPGLLSRPVGAAGKLLFRLALRNFARDVTPQEPPAPSPE
jgi:hypothetical protein